jgi:hypothetical protein
MEALREKLLAALTTQFNHEAENGVTRLREGVAPYTRFVHGELERTDQALRQLEEMRQRLSELSARVETI